MKLRKLIYSPAGRIAISVLLGFGLATLFRKACNERNCIVFQAPPLDTISEKIFRYDDNCYRYKEQAQSCDSSKATVPFA
jgi:hypothetical protein